MIQRSPLRHEVQKEILLRVADGRLPAATRINESHLSSDLGISRTPLREAMLGLEAGGFLDSDMGRGFTVPPLSRTRFQEGEAMLARLAPHALLAAHQLPKGCVMELNNLLGRARIRTADSREATLAGLVCRWTSLLSSACPNQMLIADINRLSALSRRYWSAAVALGFAPDNLLASYNEFYELLRTNQIEAGAAHWESQITRFSTAAAQHLPLLPAVT